LHCVCMYVTFTGITSCLCVTLLLHIVRSVILILLYMLHYIHVANELMSVSNNNCLCVCLRYCAAGSLENSGILMCIAVLFGRWVFNSLSA